VRLHAYTIYFAYLPKGSDGHIVQPWLTKLHYFNHVQPILAEIIPVTWIIVW